jgi:hypothetical protein
MSMGITHSPHEEEIMPALRCTRVGPGMRDSERIAEVKDIYGRRDFLRVPFGYLEVVGDSYYVPVGLVQGEPTGQFALVEFPQEGECGNWRMWVRKADLLFAKEASA